MTWRDIDAKMSAARIVPRSFVSWLRFGWPRRHIIRLVMRVWPHGSTPEWVLEWLYPGDAVITFTERPDDIETQTTGRVANS